MLNAETMRIVQYVNLWSENQIEGDFITLLLKISWKNLVCW